MAKRRKSGGNAMTIAMIAMLVVIVILAVFIGIKLIGGSIGNPLNKPKVQTEAYTDPATSAQGTRAYIQISKKDLVSADQKDFSSFISKTVQAESYVYFTIICEDGTGIVFTPNAEYVGAYGYLNSDGSIGESFGYITGTDGNYRYQAH